MNIFKLLISYFVVAIFYIPEFTRRCFGYVDFDQLSFFLFTENGAVGTDPLVLNAFFQWVILRPLLLVLFLYGIYCIFLKNRFSFLKSTLLYSIISSLLMFTGIIYNFTTYGGLAFAQRFAGEDLLKHYFHPLPTKIPNVEFQSNLILLYVESLENTFSNEEIFGSNLNHPLDEKLGESPFLLKQAPGTGWTTAGMVASQCGMPIAGFMGNRLDRRDAPIFSNLKCVSDILAEHNYQQTFFVGPDLKFSGMDKFYLQHGFQEAYGKEELFKKIDREKFGTGWGGGPNDDVVLDAAFDKIISDFQEQRKFNVTIVTTDNHAPHGYLSPRCKNENFDKQISSVVVCTNKTIARFVQKLEDNNIFKNTVLVVMGDHKFMGDLGTTDRSIYFNYYGANSQELTPVITELTHFDVFPTLIQLTLNIELQKAHLGYNIFSNNSDDYKELKNYIFGDGFLVFSDFYRSFWRDKQD